jgi:hypothetical protein
MFNWGDWKVLQISHCPPDICKNPVATRVEILYAEEKASHTGMH